jgi:DNA-binding NarL/FixJ family response regulator
MAKVRVLLADDREEVIDAVRGLLEPDYEIVGAVADGARLVSSAEELRPDVVVTDISMPHLSGLEATRKIVRKLPLTRIVLLTMYNDCLFVSEGLRSGATGYVLKSAAGEELLTAVREVIRGNLYISPRVGS